MFHALMDLLAQYGWIGLLIVSFGEASFLPLYPELVLMPLAATSPQIGWMYGLLALAGSLAGAVFGHWIGSKAGYPVLRRLMSEDRLRKTQGLFDKYGVWAIVVVGLLPLPFKLFTIASGVFKMQRSRLLLGAFIGRGVRFVGMAYLASHMARFEMKHLIHNVKEHMWTGLIIAALIVAFVWYIRSTHGAWLRERFVGLAHFLKNDFLHPVRQASRRGVLMLVVGTLVSLVLAMFGADAMVYNMSNFDNTVHTWVQGALNPTWNTWMGVIDWAFSMPVVILGYLFVSFVLLFRLRKYAKMRLFVALVIGTGLMQLFFPYFEPQPVEVAVDQLIALPSGQVMAAILLYTSLAYIGWKTTKHTGLRLLGLGVSLGLIFCAPLSPVLLGEHSFSSALGGLVAGILWISGCLLTRLIYRSIEKEQDFGRAVQ